MDINARHEAFLNIVSLITGKHKYTLDGMYDGFKTPLYLSRNPFYNRVKNPSSVNRCNEAEFYGEPGITASIGHFLVRVINEDLSALILHHFPEFMDGKPLGHSVYAEVITIYGESIICGGMTDYSGVGGAGYKLVKQVFEFLSTTLDIESETHTNTLDWQGQIRSLYSEAYDQQLEEEKIHG